MPVVPIEQNRVGIADGVTDAKLRPADFAAASAAVGQGLQAFARGVGQVGEAAYRIGEFDNQQQIKDAENDFLTRADARLNDPDKGLLFQQGRNAIDARDDAIKGLQDDMRASAATIKSAQARRDFNTAAQRRMASYVNLVDRHVGEQRTVWANQTSQARIGLNASDAVNYFDDPTKSEQAIGSIVTELAAVGQRSGWSQETLFAKTIEQVSKVRRDVVARMADTSPDAAEAYRKKYGDDFLSDDAQGADDLIAVKRRQLAAQAEHQANLAKQQINEQLSVFSQRVAAGETISDKEFQQAQQLAASIGNDAKVYDLGVKRQQMLVNNETKDWTPRQFEAEILRLRGLGDKRGPANDIRLKQLEQIAPSRVAEFNNNPGAWAANNGLPPPPLENSAARIEWARTVSKATGRPVLPLLPQEVTQLRANLGNSPAGKVAVADQIARLGPQYGYAAARQVAPSDPSLGVLVRLYPGDRAAYVNGTKARQAHPDIVDGKDVKDEVSARFKEKLGNAASLLDQGDYTATLDVAKNLYADLVTKDGTLSYDPERFDVAIHRALGGSKDAQGNWRGGVGTWNGQQVLLPSRMSQGQFETVLSRMTWKEANAPVFSNGTPMKPADIRRLTPVLRPDGRYEFHGPGGQVATGRDGTAWSLDIEAVGRAYLNR